MFQRLGAEPISLDQIKREFDTPYMKFWNRHFPNLSHEDEKKLFLEALSQVPSARMYDGVKELLHSLYSKNINMVVLSSDPSSKILPEAKNNGILGLFKEIYSEIHEKGPVLVDILKKHYFKPEETMYVGDTCGDVLAGKQAGVKTIGITWGFQHEDILKQSNPDFLIHDISKIEKLL